MSAPHPPAAPTPPCTGDALLRQIADALPTMLACFESASLRCTLANQRYADFCGRSPGDVIGMPLREAVGEQAWLQLQPHLQSALSGQAAHFTREHLLPGGAVRMLEVSLLPGPGASAAQPATQPTVPSTAPGVVMVIHDITRHWKAERALRHSEERMRKFAEATDEGLVFHLDGRILDANEALQRLTGHTPAELVGRSIFDLTLPQYRKLAMEYTRRGRDYPCELHLRHKSGRAVAVEVAGKTLPGPQGDMRVVVVRDITARRLAQDRASFLALHDTLTQLPNRRHLLLQLAGTVAAAQEQHTRMAVLFIDLDHFKTVNESLGNDAGDQLLCEMARRLQQGVKSTDFVARVGSDQFVVLLPQLRHGGDAAPVADRLIECVRAPCVIDGTPLSLSPSIGISVFPDDGDSADQLLRCAGAAMHQSKERGRGTHLFYAAGMDGQASETLQQEHLLREAVLHQHFELHYQPQTHVDTGRLAGFEALVRWHHPQRGLLGPDEFIPLAESRGLIAPLGRWVLHEACRQLKAWQDEGLPRVPVAVNLSAIEFRQCDVASEVARVLHATGLEPRYLEVEITESALMQHDEHTRATLQQLRALGVAVTVDDFGTGYSSLAYLKRYPLDKIKVDRSFVTDTPGDAEDVAIVTAIIQLARSLQLKPVAEGVENAAQLALLQRLGCDLVQGFGIAPPMDAQHARDWLRAQIEPTQPTQPQA